MKERPILFSAPMVKALLREDNPKSMTRRIIKNAPAILDQPGILPSLIEAYKKAWVKTCPYGQPGDRLWVRETWAQGPVFRADAVKDDSGERDGWWVQEGPGADKRFVPHALRWHPSIFMPRFLSRITLEITAVQVERVQDMSNEDAEREGFRWCNEAAPVDMFMCLWNKLNAKSGHGWDVNDWVRVISFRRL